MTRPADFPAPFSLDEAIGVPTDPVDERIDVGVLIVGAGPAGLACAVAEMLPRRARYSSSVRHSSARRWRS